LTFLELTFCSPGASYSVFHVISFLWSVFAVEISMAQSEISKPIHVTLDGDNYSLWVQGMCSFVKGRKLWLYVTGQRHPPKQ
jgi:hypothetical protein